MRQWLIEILSNAAVTTMLIGAAAWLGRTQITQWLTRDLEALKHKHAREIEAYKVQLVAEVERTKAAHEVRKIGALKVLEMKFASLHKLHLACINNAGTFLIFAQKDPGHRTQDLRQDADERLKKLGE